MRLLYIKQSYGSINQQNRIGGKIMNEKRAAEIVESINLNAAQVTALKWYFKQTEKGQNNE